MISKKQNQIRFMAQWLVGLLCKQKVGGLNPTVDKNVHFVILNCFKFIAAWLSQYKCNQQWHTGGHQIIGRTQLPDVTLFRALQMQICEICIQRGLLHEKLKPHKKNGQITTNNKPFTVENVCPSYPPTICTLVKYFKTWNFSQKIATITHLSYSLEILI